MRIDIRHHALAANTHIDALLNEEVTLRYKGRPITILAQFKKDQVETTDTAGNVALVDREYLLVQDRFVLKNLSQHGTIEREDVFGHLGKQTRHYTILNQAPVGNGWTMIHLKRERAPQRTGMTRNERHPSVYPDTDPASFPRSAR